MKRLIHPVTDLDRLTKALSDRYTIEREIGRGGMATVYLAEEFHPQRKVAIKVMTPDFGTRILRERFLREVNPTSKLTHPHIVPVFAAGEADDPGADNDDLDTFHESMVAETP